MGKDELRVFFSRCITRTDEERAARLQDTSRGSLKERLAEARVAKRTVGCMLRMSYAEMLAARERVDRAVAEEEKIDYMIYWIEQDLQHLNEQESGLSK